MHHDVIVIGGSYAGIPHSVSLAVGNGAMAGAQVHRSLLWPENVQPLQEEAAVP